MNKHAKWIGFGLLTLSLTGCGPQTGNVVQPGADVMNATRGAANTTRGMVHSTATSMQDPRSMHMSKNIADGLVRDGYAKHAYVFVVGDTAYVAVDRKQNVKTNQALQEKNKIIATVKRLDRRVKTVFVSTNPNVMTRFQSFAGDLSKGRPVQAVWDNFRTTIASAFPTTK